MAKAYSAIIRSNLEKDYDFSERKIFIGRNIPIYDDHKEILEFLESSMGESIRRNIIRFVEEKYIYREITRKEPLHWLDEAEILTDGRKELYHYILPDGLMIHPFSDEIVNKNLLIDELYNNYIQYIVYTDSRIERWDMYMNLVGSVPDYRSSYFTITNYKQPTIAGQIIPMPTEMLFRWAFDINGSMYVRRHKTCLISRRNIEPLFPRFRRRYLLSISEEYKGYTFNMAQNVSERTILTILQCLSDYPHCHEEIKRRTNENYSIVSPDAMAGYFYQEIFDPQLMECKMEINGKINLYSIPPDVDWRNFIRENYDLPFGRRLWGIQPIKYITYEDAYLFRLCSIYIDQIPKDEDNLEEVVETNEIEMVYVFCYGCFELTSLMKDNMEKYAIMLGVSKISPAMKLNEVQPIYNSIFCVGKNIWTKCNIDRCVELYERIQEFRRVGNSENIIGDFPELMAMDINAVDIANTIIEIKSLVPPIEAIRNQLGEWGIKNMESSLITNYQR